MDIFGRTNQSPMRPFQVAVIGPRLTEDLLVWEQLGRAIKPSPERPLVLLHSPGEVTERILEGDGLALAHAGRSPETDQAIEDACRQENHGAVSALTDGGLPAVGFLGVDRRILSDSNPLSVRMELLATMASTGTIPLITLLRRTPHGLSIVPAAEVVEAMAGASIPPRSVDWLIARRAGDEISRSDTVKLSGESRLPEASRLGYVSIRVSGVSELGSVASDRGATLT